MKPSGRERKQAGAKGGASKRDVWCSLRVSESERDTGMCDALAAESVIQTLDSI